MVMRDLVHQYYSEDFMFILISAPLLPGCVALGKLLNRSMPQFLLYKTGLIVRDLDFQHWGEVCNL